MSDGRGVSDGLTSAEARDRLARMGPNRIERKARSGPLRLFLRQVANPLVLMLVIAAVLAMIVGEHRDAIIILGIVLLGAVLGWLQEHRASKAVEKLAAIVAVRATAVRDGQPREVLVEEIVPDDVVLLSAGSLVPADAELIASKDLHVDEATLTGETFPAEKHAGAQVFLGTHVVSGTGRARVARTGRETELGKIADRLRDRRPVPEFERGVQRFGMLLVRVTAILVIAIFAVDVYLRRPVLDSFLFALALAVGLVPELLPAIVGINLAQGARRMARARVIVKRLAAIEDFGSMDVLCSDKTGTLTEGTVRLEGAFGVDGEPSDEVLRWAAANAAFESGFTNPIDQAIRATRPVDPGVKKLDEVPYDFIRKRLSVLVEQGDEITLVTKGAVAQMIEVCTTCRMGGREVPMDEARAAVEARFSALSEAGWRTLGVAIRRVPDRSPVTREAERDMTFLGFLSLFDPPRAEIEQTLARLRELGITLKIITGDNHNVARTLARRVGIADPVIMTGTELRHTSDQALRSRAPSVHVFAEVEPNQKERIILALKRAGAVVGYLGDGINDAPALHAADVAISVANAADVAREAAEIVLLDADLRVLLEGVRQGRTTFANTLKYVYITTSANFGNMISVAGAALFLPFLPLLPSQILLNNLLSDLPAMTIANDRVDPEQLDRPRRWDPRRIRNFMIVFGGISSLFDYLTFALLLHLGASPAEFRSAWFVESLLTEILILLVIRTRRSALRSRPSDAMLTTTAIVGVAAVVVVYPPFGALFGFVALPASLLLWLIPITLGYLLASEIAKRRFA